MLQVLSCVNEMAEGYDSCDNHMGASSSPLLSRSCSSTQSLLAVEPPLQPPWSSDQDEGSGDFPAGMRSSERASPGFYEELFCTRQTQIPLAPLAGALMAASGPQSDVVKRGYLGKLERNHKRYFVLRAGSHTGPSRLEWYKSQEKFTAMEKSAGKTGLFGSNKQGLVKVMTSNQKRLMDVTSTTCCRKYLMLTA